METERTLSATQVLNPTQTMNQPTRRTMNSDFREAKVTLNSNKAKRN